MTMRRLRPALAVLAMVATATTLSGCAGSPAPGGAGTPTGSPASTSSSASDGASSAATSTGQPGAAGASFEPRIATENITFSFTVPAGGGTRVAVNATEPAAKVSGVGPAEAEAFAAATQNVRDELHREFTTRLQGLEPSLLECTSSPCVKEFKPTAMQIGVFREYGTYSLISGQAIPSNARWALSGSVTMNLRTGKPAELSEFIDLTKGEGQDLLRRQLAASPQGGQCAADVAVMANNVGAWSPAEDGLHLAFTDVPGVSEGRRGCDLIQVTLPWTNGAGGSDAAGAGRAG